MSLIQLSLLAPTSSIFPHLLPFEKKKRKHYLILWPLHLSFPFFYSHSTKIVWKTCSHNSSLPQFSFTLPETLYAFWPLQRLLLWQSWVTLMLLTLRNSSWSSFYMTSQEHLTQPFSSSFLNDFHLLVFVMASPLDSLLCHRIHLLNNQ